MKNLIRLLHYFENLYHLGLDLRISDFVQSAGVCRFPNDHQPSGFTPNLPISVEQGDPKTDLQDLTRRLVSAMRPNISYFANRVIVDINYPFRSYC